ncbi:MAG: tripartite tricarboxylate transporter TctB family protein [Aquamicrobium sp.]|uniref:tripartite tricarboxylate transporter TctB family protein n=1 Tax=Aquamicrobium sp. TaxID=1872579 RepID=UPI00349E96EF|nr:tripartite tricarboxylate transporter TctB family protein [Aquamicrobium sp.]
MTFNRSDLGAGAIFVAIGLFFGVTTLMDLDIGTARRMGPGFFPIMLSGILIALGLIIALKSVGHADEARGPLPWRGLVVLLSVPVIFGMLIRPLGMAPVLALTTFVTSFASTRMSLKAAVLLALGLTIFCVVVFNFGLGLPLRLFGPLVEPWTRPIFGVR